MTLPLSLPCLKSEAMPENGNDLFDSLAVALRPRYVLERELGRGKTGVVFLAHEVALDRQVGQYALRADWQGNRVAASLELQSSQKREGEAPLRAARLAFLCPCVGYVHRSFPRYPAAAHTFGTQHRFAMANSGGQSVPLELS